MVEKTFLGCLMKADYLLHDIIIQPGYLESVRHKELMRRMVDLKRAGKGIDLLTFTTLPDLESFGGMSYLINIQLDRVSATKCQKSLSLSINGFNWRVYPLKNAGSETNAYAKIKTEMVGGQWGSRSTRYANL
ncbi:hypothetical protein H5P36_22880 [Bacillus sp. APMAM]|nr:hypothetical protein [Bacillus sp. APMAM]RTZ53554.1 hypothetical protein EKO25_22730 [Bacillus sp. SAJ1]